MTTVFEMKAEVDPKFQIYLCFGQSNMEGGVPAEGVERGLLVIAVQRLFHVSELTVLTLRTQT